MQNIKWTPDLAIGIQIIDDQHKEVLDRMDKLLQVLQYGEIAYHEYLHLLKYLDDYTKQHFSEEELYMLRNSYPLYDEHIKKHKAFRDELKELKEIRFDKIETVQLLKKRLKENVIDWFVNHISTVDILLKDIKNK